MKADREGVYSHNQYRVSGLKKLRRQGRRGLVEQTGKRGENREARGSRRPVLKGT